MLHVLFLVLKVILITLLMILGILLLLMLLILFAPFRYTFEGEYFDDFKFVGRIRWLIFVLDLKAIYNEKKFLYYLRSFGGIISTNDDVKPGFFARAAQKRKEKRDAKNALKETAKQKKSKQKKQPENIEKEKRSLEKAGDIKELEKQIDEKQVKRESWVKRIYRKAVETKEKIVDFFRDIKKQIRRFFKKLGALKNQSQEVVLFLKAKETKEAVKAIIKHMIAVGKHIAPSKLSGYIKIGMDDPAATGEIFGILGILLPLYYNKLTLIPDFEEKIIEGHVSGKGRIRFVFFLKLLFKIYNDDNIMKTLKKANSLLGGS